MPHRSSPPIALAAAVLVMAAALSPSSASGGVATASAARPLPWFRPMPAPTLPDGTPLRLRTAVPARTPAGPGTGSWADVSPPWPDSTAGGGMAHDPVRDETLFFGGCCFQGETWLWKGGGWTLAQPTVSPSARAGVAMAWDDQNENIVMFGGTEEAETWTWDGATWTLHHPPISPQFRSDASMAYAPALKRVVLFGGYPNVVTQGQLNDTWEWDGSSWTQAQPAHVPPARYGAGLAADPATGNVVLFGGLDDGYHSLSDTWVFDGTDWQEVTRGSSPSPRSYVQMATNPDIGAVELFGGYDLEAGASQVGDEWMWKGGRWRPASRSSLPTARCCGGFVYEASTNSMLLFDGTCRPTCGGMWIEHGARWRERPLPRPLERMGGGFAADGAIRASVLFGGFGDSFGSGALNDTWLWKRGAWRVVAQTQAPGVTAPAIRQGTAMAFDRRIRRVVLFGGLGTHYPNPQLGDTWTFDGTSWTQISPGTSPSARYDHMMARNPGGGVVLFGGYGTGGLLAETWIYRDGTWTQMNPPTSPSARYLAVMGYDRKRDQVVLFGGGMSGGTTIGDTWVWDGSTWTQMNPATSPTPRMAASMAYDQAAGELWLFGGAGCASVACTLTNDVWRWDGSTWNRQVATSGPTARWFADAARSAGGKVVLFGGQDGGSSPPFSDTWLWKDG